jgi:hypothetical protein
MLSADFYKGMKIGRRLLGEVENVRAVMIAAIEAQEFVTGAEKYKAELDAAVAGLEAQKASLVIVIADEQARINAHLAEYGGVAAAEQAKLHAQVESEKLRAKTAVEDADAVVKACAEREAEATAKAEAAEKRLADAEKAHVAFLKKVGG